MALAEIRIIPLPLIYYPTSTILPLYPHYYYTTIHQFNYKPKVATIGTHLDNVF